MQQSHFNTSNSLNNCSFMKPLPDNLNDIYIGSSIMYKRSYLFGNENFLIDLHNDWTEIENKNDWQVYPNRVSKSIHYNEYFDDLHFDFHELGNAESKCIDKYLFKDIPEKSEDSGDDNPKMNTNADLENISEDDNTYDCCSLWSIDESFCCCENKINSSKENFNQNKEGPTTKNNIQENDIKEMSASTETSSCQSDIASPIFEIITPSNKKSIVNYQSDINNQSFDSFSNNKNELNETFAHLDDSEIKIHSINESTVSVTNKIDFNHFEIESENTRDISLGNVIENNDECSTSSKVEILCHEIISGASTNIPNVLVLPVKDLDPEKDATNLAAENKHISEFLCNEVYLNSQLIDDLSIFSDNSSFNRDSTLTSSIKMTIESDDSIAKSSNLSSNKTSKDSQLKHTKPTNTKKSILKTKYREELTNLPCEFKAKRIKKKVSFNEAELVNNVKRRKIFINNEEKIRNKIYGKKKCSKKSSGDQVFVTTVAVKKMNDDKRCQIDSSDDIKRKKKKKSLDDRRKNSLHVNNDTVKKANCTYQSRTHQEETSFSLNRNTNIHSITSDGDFESTALEMFSVDTSKSKVNDQENNDIFSDDSLRKTKQFNTFDQKANEDIPLDYEDDCQPESQRSPCEKLSDEVDSTSSENNGVFILNNCYKPNEHNNQVTELEAKVVDKLKNGMAVYKLHKKLPNGEKQVYSDIRYYFNKVFNHLDILTPDLEANYNEGMMEIIVYDNEQFIKQYGENAGVCVIENYQLVVNSLLPSLIKDNQPKEIVVYDNEGNESMLQLDSLLQAIENHNAKKN